MENDGRRPQEEEGEVNLTLALFDLYWFRSLILLHLQPPPPPSPPPPPRPPSPPPRPPPAAELKIEDAESGTSSPTSVSPLHRRSLSDDLSPSPKLQIHPPKLQAILSGKEPSPGYVEIPMFEVTVEEHGQRWKNRRDRRRRRRRLRRRRSESSKSLSELEFKELKGFMDLGFTFSDAETDPRLMEIVPGLQRLKEAAAGGGDKEPPPPSPPPQPAAGDEEAVSSSASADDVAVRRPYLSEAWDAVEEEEEEVNRLRNFKIPMAEDGADLKDQLRFWAHAVASSVL